MRWRIAILLAVITTINYIDRSVFGVVAPVVRGEFGIGDADYGLITSGFFVGLWRWPTDFGSTDRPVGYQTRLQSCRRILERGDHPACRESRTVELFHAASDSGYCRGGELSGCQ